MAETTREVIDVREKKRIAFVGSGGAVKALAFHLGVLMALEEYGITVRGYGGKYEIVDLVGSSAGSLFGAFVTNNFSFDRITSFLEEKSFFRYFINNKPREKGKLYGLSYKDIFPPNVPSLNDIVDTAARRLTWKRYKHAVNDIGELARTFVPEVFRTGDVEGSLEHFLKNAGKDYMGIEGLLREMIPIQAISNTDSIEKYLEDILEINDFLQLRRERGIDFYVIASELNRPRKAIFGPKRSEYTTDPWADRYVDTVPISTACSASSALPIIYRPKKIVVEGEKNYYIDGEVKQTLSIDVAREAGADLIIISHTLEPYKYDFTKQSLTRHGVVSIITQSVFISVAQKIRSAWQIHELKHTIYDYISTPEFQRELDAILKDSGNGKSKKLREHLTEFLQETVAKVLRVDKKIQYIYIPSDNEVFWMDHFNIFPHYMKRLANAGYRRTRESIEQNYELIL